MISTDFRTKDGKSPTDPRLLHNPLDFLAEDHLRLRTMCHEMDRIAGLAQPSGADLAGLLEYLTEELPLLLADEDEDLLPRLKRRAAPEDELPKLMVRLNEEHETVSLHVRSVAGALAEQVPADAIPPQTREALRDLANITRRHLFLENAVLLPLARARLTADDLYSLRLAMLTRRGLKDLFPA